MLGVGQTINILEEQPINRSLLQKHVWQVKFKAVIKDGFFILFITFKAVIKDGFFILFMPRALKTLVAKSCASDSDR